MKTMGDEVGLIEKEDEDFWNFVEFCNVAQAK